MPSGAPPLAHNEQQAALQQQFGNALRLVSDRLEVLLQTKHRQALRSWKEKIHTVSGACKWLKREEAAPLLVADEASTVHTQPSTILPVLKSFWARTFGCDQDQDRSEQFWERYAPYVRQPSTPWPQLLPVTGAQLREAAKASKHKAGGPDGLSPDMLAALPAEALDRLTALLAACEECGRFPTNMRHWRVVFIPKKRKGKIASVDELRPIAVGPIVYRLWSRVRMQALMGSLSSSLLPSQGGGIRGHDAETLLASFHLDFPPDQWPHGVMLDYAKAFDSTDAQLCIDLFQRTNMPSPIISLIKDQWANHSRWLSFGGATLQNPLTQAKGIPQGDPWAPVALALLLSLPAQDVHARVPQANTLLYLDDRTVLARSRPALLQAVEVWNEFETLTRLKTNISKTKFFARTSEALNEGREARPPVTEAAEMLGVTVGVAGRARSLEETKRMDAAVSIANRLAHMPLAFNVKAYLASSLCAPKAAWGALLGGHPLRQAVRKQFNDCFRYAVIGRKPQSDSASPELQRVLILGHCSDLGIVALQRTVGALARWAALSRSRGEDPRRVQLRGSQLFDAVTSEFQRFGWWPGRRWGTFVDRARRSWDISAPKALQLKAAHLLRDAWRLAQVVVWRDSPSRRDSALARSINLQITTPLINKLRSLARKQNGDGLAVMCGGASMTPLGLLLGQSDTSVTCATDLLCPVFPISFGSAVSFLTSGS